jgi:hypothetical protein
MRPSLPVGGGGGNRELTTEAQRTQRQKHREESYYLLGLPLLCVLFASVFNLFGRR